MVVLLVARSPSAREITILILPISGLQKKVPSSSRQHVTSSESLLHCMRLNILELLCCLTAKCRDTEHSKLLYYSHLPRVWTAKARYSSPGFTSIYPFPRNNHNSVQEIDLISAYTAVLIPAMILIHHDMR